MRPAALFENLEDGVTELKDLSILISTKMSTLWL
jgi:hypothetical protein